jgi:hypothetical protein
MAGYHPPSTGWAVALSQTEQSGKDRQMNTVNQMVEEIRLELSQGVELEDIKDRSGEYVDSYLPVYNNRIVEEWQNMPSEYDNRGSAEFGHLGQEINIINLMSLDLYLYYSDLFTEAIQEVEDELELVSVEAIKEGANSEI